jgi:hypothetical protein
MSVTAFPGDRRRIAPLEIPEVQAMLAYWRDIDAAITRGQTFDAKHLTRMLRSVAQDCERVIQRINSKPKLRPAKSAACPRLRPPLRG